VSPVRDYVVREDEMFSKIFRNRSIKTKLSLISFVVVFIFFAVLTVFISMTTTRYFNKNSMEALQAEVKLVKDMVTMFDETAKSSSTKMLDVFKSLFENEITMDSSKTVLIGSQETPVLKSGNTVLNLNLSYVDQFTKMTGNSVATVFVKKGSDFIRIATSLKKEDGSRAIGTVLDHNHPGYAKLLNGEPYIGKAKLFGRDYMTKYLPIKDKNGIVLGSLFIGFDITDTLKNLSDLIKAVKIGDSGYIYVLDDKEGPTRGTLLVHPAQEGKNILDSKDANGREFIKEILDKNEGIIVYPWLNKELGEKTPRDKLLPTLVTRIGAG